MTIDHFEMRWGPTETWKKLQQKLDGVDKEIDAITIKLCDEIDAAEVRKLKRKRNELVLEKRFLVRARRKEPMRLEISGGSALQIFQEAEEKAYADGWPKDNH